MQKANDELRSLKLIGVSHADAEEMIKQVAVFRQNQVEAVKISQEEAATRLKVQDVQLGALEKRSSQLGNILAAVLSAVVVWALVLKLRQSEI